MIEPIWILPAKEKHGVLHCDCELLAKKINEIIKALNVLEKKREKGKK